MKLIIFFILCLQAFCFDIYSTAMYNFYGQKIAFEPLRDSAVLLFVSYNDCSYDKEIKKLNSIYKKHRDLKIFGFAFIDRDSSKKQDKPFCIVNYGAKFDMFDLKNKNNTRDKFESIASYLQSKSDTKDIIYKRFILYRGNLSIFDTYQDENISLYLNKLGLK